MEYLMVTLTVINSLLLIGIAGSLSKMIRYDQNNDQSNEYSKKEWSEIIKNRRNLDKQMRAPNYSDTSMITPNWDGMQKSRNWDGIPSKKE